MIPDNAVSRPVAAVAAAVIGGATSFPDICAAVDRGKSATWFALIRARRLGLVDWTDGQHGTIHPVVEIVAASPRRRR